MGKNIFLIDVKASEVENPNSLLASPDTEAENTNGADGNAQTESVSQDSIGGPNLGIEDVTIDADVNTNESNVTEAAQSDIETSGQEEIITEVKTEVQENVPANNVSGLMIGGIVFVVLFIVLLLVFLDKKKTKKYVVLKDGERMTEAPELTNKAVKIMQTAENCPVKVASIHDVGRRNMQQDSFGVSDVENEEFFASKGVMAIVADGMGGLSAGERMSQLVVVTMLQGFDQDTEMIPTPSLLLKLVNDANSAVNKELGEAQIGKSGSTLTAVVVKERTLSWISVGDSHIYVCRNGQMMKINQDHNYATELDEMVKQGEISMEEAMRDPQRAALTSYIGMGKLELVDQNETPIKLENNDRILLMSDGVFGTVDEMTICEIMKKPLHQACDQLEHEIRSKNKRNQDNYTCVVLEVE